MASLPWYRWRSEFHPARDIVYVGDGGFERRLPEGLVLARAARHDGGSKEGMPMQLRTSIAALAASAAALVLAGWTGGLAPSRVPLLVDNSPAALAVDAELVIAVDVSNSMDPEEQAL